MNIDLQGLLAAAKTFPQFGYTGLFILLIETAPSISETNLIGVRYVCILSEE